MNSIVLNGVKWTYVEVLYVQDPTISLRTLRMLQVPSGSIFMQYNIPCSISMSSFSSSANHFGGVLVKENG